MHAYMYTKFNGIQQTNEQQQKTVKNSRQTVNMLFNNKKMLAYPMG